MSNSNDYGSADSNLTPSTTHTSLSDYTSQQVLVDCHSPLPTLPNEGGMMGPYWGVVQDPRTDPTLTWKLQLLPVLDHGATQVLNALASGPFQHSEEEQAYTASVGLFEETRLLYSRAGIFLDSFEVHSADPMHGETVRKANIATFLSHILAQDKPDLLLLDRHFLDCFVPIGRELLEWQAELFLSVKTQAYMTCYLPGDNWANHQIVEELFPLDLGDRLVTRHPHSRNLSKAEMEFVENAMARRQLLLSEASKPYFLSGPQDKYPWMVLVGEIRNTLPKILDSIAPHVSTDRRISTADNGNWQTEPYPTASRPAHAHPTGADDSHVNLAAPLITHSQHVLPDSRSPSQGDGMINYDQRGENAAISQRQSELSQHGLPTPDQPSTTAALYRQARLMTNESPAPRSKRSGGSSRRRPWSDEEEEALLNGLDYVKGSHWSQIQRLYGHKGLISDVLKDRNQVQLKDKARNLKLFFIKAGLPVPEALQRVTGEVKKRKRDDETRGSDGPVEVYEDADNAEAP